MTKTACIAHRGASGHAPENTLLAFAKALELGADGIELDVRITLDGSLVVYHDESLERLTGHHRLVTQMTYNELLGHRLRQEQHIPTLDETLSFLNDRCLLNVEIKASSAALAVVDLLTLQINKGLWRASNLLVSSFDTNVLAQIAKLSPGISLGVITSDDFEGAISFATKIKASSVHPHYSLINDALVAKAHANRLKVFAWTVNDPLEIARLKNLSVDAVITDYPDRL
jgi:glycerophosphoryl diester phosphodiesterase